MKNYFSEIYKLAQEKNESKLEALLQLDVSIDEFEQGTLLTAAEKLFMEGDYDAVQFLIKYQANVSFIGRAAAKLNDLENVAIMMHSGGGSRHVVFAAAAYGHFELCKSILENPKVNGACYNDLACGCAFAGNFEDANFFLKRQNDKPADAKERDVSLDDLAYNSALGGHDDHVKEWHKMGASTAAIARGYAVKGDYNAAETWCTMPADFNEMAWGLGFGGHEDLIMKLIYEKPYIDKKHYGYGAATAGHIYIATFLGLNHNELSYRAALGGHHLYAKSLVSKRNVEITFPACGAAAGGFADFAAFLCRAGANPEEIASHAASAGFFGMVEAWGVKPNIHKIAFAAAYAGYFPDAEKLVKQDPTVIPKIILGAQKGHHLNELALWEQRLVLWNSTNNLSASAFSSMPISTSERIKMKPPASSMNPNCYRLIIEILRPILLNSTANLTRPSYVSLPAANTQPPRTLTPKSAVPKTSLTSTPIRLPVNRPFVVPTPKGKTPQTGIPQAVSFRGLPSNSGTSETAFTHYRPTQPVVSKQQPWSIPTPKNATSPAVPASRSDASEAGCTRYTQTMPTSIAIQPTTSIVVPTLINRAQTSTSNALLSSQPTAKNTSSETVSTTTVSPPLPTATTQPNVPLLSANAVSTPATFFKGPAAKEAAKNNQPVLNSEETTLKANKRSHSELGETTNEKNSEKRQKI